MSDYKIYSDCKKCEGDGEYENGYCWYDSIPCDECAERYIVELRELLYSVLEYEIPSAVAEKIALLLQTAQEKPSNTLEWLGNAIELVKRK